MKAVSPIFKDRGKREVYLLALAVVLILALCTLIAATAFASTEAEPPDIKTDTIEMKDGTKIVVESASALVKEIIKPEPPKMLYCQLTAQANFSGMIKTTHKEFEMPQEDATVLSTKLREIVARAKAGGAEGGEIYCYTVDPASPDNEYRMKF